MSRHGGIEQRGFVETGTTCAPPLAMDYYKNMLPSEGDFTLVVFHINVDLTVYGRVGSAFCVLPVGTKPGEAVTCIWSF